MRASLMEISRQCHASCLVIHFYRDKQRLPVSNNTNRNGHVLGQRFYLPFKCLYRIDPLAINGGQYVSSLQTSEPSRPRIDFRYKHALAHFDG